MGAEPPLAALAAFRLANQAASESYLHDFSRVAGEPAKEEPVSTLQEKCGDSMYTNRGLIKCRVTV